MPYIYVIGGGTNYSPNVDQGVANTRRKKKRKKSVDASDPLGLVAARNNASEYVVFDAGLGRLKTASG